MIEVVEKDTGRYQEQFEELRGQIPATEPRWMEKRRQEALDRFSGMGFPSPGLEEWKYTDVSPLRDLHLEIGALPEQAVHLDQVERLRFGTRHCPTLVCVNGHFVAGLSNLEDLPFGIEVGSLQEWLRERPEILEPVLARHAHCEGHPFVALNTAFMQDGMVVHVPDGQVVETPIHFLSLVTTLAGPVMVSPRNLVLAGASSQVTVLESYLGLDGGTYLTNLVTEIVASENAVVDHYKLHDESREAFHISTLQIHQQRSSNVRAFNATLGGRLTRNEVNALLDGEGAVCGLDGLFVISDRQHVDNHTRLEHAKAHCDSRENYKGVLDGRSTGVFHGRILVHRGAQKTDSKQTNNNLLLSDDALINSKPQLEIYADDVKCTHGATIGQLDENALFYLRSRGIDLRTARSLLIYAFANQIVSRVKVEALRNELDDYLFSWLPGGTLVKEAV